MNEYDQTFNTNILIGHYDLISWFSDFVIVIFHGSAILPYCMLAKRCMSIMLWVTGRVWPYV